MPFFINQQNLSLADYKNIWSKFCFMDESGSLENKLDPFFTIGFLKCSEPSYFLNTLMGERNRAHFYDELKFNKLSRRNIDFLKLAVDTLFNTPSINFYSYSSYKGGTYFKSEFNSNPWQAYEDIAIKVLRPNLAPNEVCVLLADYKSDPDGINFEINTKRKINDELQRLALAGVCRIDSKGTDFLQMADLFVSAINYDLKYVNKCVKGDRYKLEFLEYFKDYLGIGGQDFLSGFRGRGFSIFVDKDVKEYTPTTSL